MSLSTPATFFAALKAGLLGPDLSQGEVDGCNAILAAMEGAPLSHTAYALATAYHETASTMQPIEERGGPIYFTRLYDVSGARPKLCIANGNTCAGDGPRYFGRGLVQITWKTNYEKASKVCGVDMVAKPELALKPEHAAKIMRSGMDEGWFTGKSFNSYLPNRGPAERGQFSNARRIINGLDKAAQIAEHAMEFQRALQAGGWR